MIYQPYHLESNQATLITDSHRFQVVPHLHRNFELLYLYDGQIEAAVDDRTYTLKAGDCLLVFPHQIHTYHSEMECRTTVIVFSEDLVNRFVMDTKHKFPADNRVVLPASFFKHMEFDHIFQLKALLYRVCGQMYRQTSFVEDRQNRHGQRLLEQILQFVDQHYLETCSLQELACELQYDYYYLSKYFIHNTGISFNEFVNEYRISHACNLLIHPNYSIQDIAGQCGFRSVRNFNRVFLQRRQITPSEYRKKFTDIFHWFERREIFF